MKIKNIRITMKGRGKVLPEFAHVVEKARQGETIFPKKEVSFENIEALRKMLTPKRMELLHGIKEYSPHSVYELAKILQRDIKSITTDLQILETLGFISFEYVQEERKKVKPKVEFDKIQVEITL